MRDVRITTWNVGFGALGAEADVHFEGGRSIIPSSKSAVQKNISGLAHVVSTNAAQDIFLFQEITTGSLLNHFQDQLSPMKEALAAYTFETRMQFRIPFLPRPYACEHGLSVATKEKASVTYTGKDFSVGDRYYKIIKRFDTFLAAHFPLPDGRTLTVVNVHFAAFDLGGIIRLRQFQEVMGYAQDMQRSGPVIVGGDWNLVFGARTTAQGPELRFRVHLPVSHVPHEWCIAYDPIPPTMRGASFPWQKGRSPTATIDGFILSPDVELVSVTTEDLEFAFSDHNPVHLHVRV